MTAKAAVRAPLAHRVSAALYRRRGLKIALLLLLPGLWIVGLYGGSLIALLINSFYRLDAFTGRVLRVFTLDTWRALFTESNISIATRTVTMAAAVTVAAAVLAFPLAYFMARYATGKLKAALYLAVLLPLWSSYLVRVYSWKLILAREGIVFWFMDHLGLRWLLDGLLSLPGIGGNSLSSSWFGLWVVFVYVWLPFMILPIHAAVEKIPRSLLEASADLGGKPGYTFRRVVWPLAFPGVVAGSIFTFSLTLGDYIIPTIIGDSSPFVGLAIYSYQGVAGNLPLAAAFSFFPIVVMGVYLLGARRLGAMENL